MDIPQPIEIDYGRSASTLAGHLWIAVTKKGVFATEFDMPEAHFLQLINHRSPNATLRRDESRIAEVCMQLREYFRGERQAFELSLDLAGLPVFQQAVLLATLAIPYGETATYAEIARLIGHPGAARAVGRAEATNPIALIIPCHRVVGSDGKLHGYGGPGGIKLKAKLLELEQSL